MSNRGYYCKKAGDASSWMDYPAKCLESQCSECALWEAQKRIKELESDLAKAYERLRGGKGYERWDFYCCEEVPGPQGARCQSRSGMGQCELTAGHVEDHLANGLRWMRWAGDGSIHSRPTSADHYTCMRCKCSWDRPGPKMCPICEKEDQVVYPYI